MVSRSHQDVIELGGQLPRLASKHVDRSGTENGARPTPEIVSASASADGLVIEARCVVPSTGRAGCIGAVEEIVDGRRLGH
jgi:hypothetical protein